jgi:hypothetical protein
MFYTTFAISRRTNLSRILVRFCISIEPNSYRAVVIQSMGWNNAASVTFLA